MFHTDPRTTPPNRFRMDLCVTIDSSFAAGGIEAGTIPGGRTAVLRVDGSSAEIEAGALFLGRDWLPASGETEGDSPLICKRDAAGAELLLRLKPRAT